VSCRAVARERFDDHRQRATLDPHARHQRRNRQRRFTSLLDHDCSGTEFRLLGIDGRIKVEPAATLERSLATKSHSRRCRIEHVTTRDRPWWRVGPNNEGVPSDEDNRSLEPQADVASRSGSQRIAFRIESKPPRGTGPDQRHTTQDLCSSLMKTNSSAMFDWLGIW
jgi:hypothetical protein